MLSKLTDRFVLIHESESGVKKVLVLLESRFPINIAEIDRNKPVKITASAPI